MTASFPNRNLVVASVQSSTEITPNYQTSTEIPLTRENGGDLQPGDTWYNKATELFYLYTGDEWIIVGGPGMFRELNRENS